jgi:hypothetical protein
MEDSAPAGEKEIKTKLVKMDGRHGYIQWLLDWDRKPRRPLTVYPEELRASADAFRAVRESHERVLAQFKRCGYAYVEIDVLDADDPEANIDDDQYDEVDGVDV